MTSSPDHTDKHIFSKSILFSLGFTFLLWLVKAVEWSISTDLGIYGILPRTLSGIVGIFTAPLIHGNTLHLLSNTFPLFLLLMAVFYFYNRIALEVFLWIYLITGFWVWIAAREAYHIGSSGLVYGLAAFLFFSGIFRKDTRSVAVALVILFLYGGMLQGVMPTSENISWESHLLGSAAGMLCSFYFKKTEDTNPKKDKDIQSEDEDNTYTLLHTASNTYTHHDEYRIDPAYRYSMTENKKMKFNYTYSEDAEDSTASEI